MSKYLIFLFASNVRGTIYLYGHWAGIGISIFTVGRYLPIIILCII